MSYLKGFLDIKEKAAEQGLNPDKLVCDILPSQLYDLLGEMEGTDMINKDRITKCRQAIINRDLKGVKDSMPVYVHGVELSLVLPGEVRD